MSRRLQIQAAGVTHVGLVRSHNEDRFAVLPLHGLFLVADGMGGAAAGEVAATMAVDSICEAFEDADVTWPPGKTPSSADARALLVAAIERANHRIFGAAEADLFKRGMGTTIAAALVSGARVVLAHVGDSRLYRMRRGRLELLSEDHSLVNELVRAGFLDPEKAESHPLKNTITRALGAKEAVEVETRIIDTMPGDTLLVASDGVCGVLEHREIAAILSECRDPERASARLVERANERGGPDNATAVVIRWSLHAAEEVAATL